MAYPVPAFAAIKSDAANPVPNGTLPPRPTAGPLQPHNASPRRHRRLEGRRRAILIESAEDTFFESDAGNPAGAVREVDATISAHHLNITLIVCLIRNLYLRNNALNLEFQSERCTLYSRVTDPRQQVQREQSCDSLSCFA